MEQSMNVNTQKIKELRELRAWSQEQLANAAGLSLRTVQRAENEGTASRETKVCLAAALGIDHSTLNPVKGPPDALNADHLVAKVTAQAFFTAGIVMIAAILLTEDGIGSSVFWIGLVLSVCGAVSAMRAIAIKRQQIKA